MYQSRCIAFHAFYNRITHFLRKTLLFGTIRNSKMIDYIMTYECCIAQGNVPSKEGYFMCNNGAPSCLINWRLSSCIKLETAALHTANEFMTNFKIDELAFAIVLA
jgi:hypothetical protein